MISHRKHHRPIRRFAIAAAVALCMIPAPVLAESFFRGGDVVEIVETVKGDAVVVGRKLIIDADIEGDLNAMGASVTINRDVDGDLRTAGQDVRINGEIDGDLSAYGRRVVLGADAELDGDADFYGGDVVLLGRVEGALTVRGDHILLNGRVDGDVHVAADAFEIGPDAIFHGEVLYDGKTPAVIDPQARLSEGLTWEGGSWTAEMFDEGLFSEYSWKYGDGARLFYDYREPLRERFGIGALLVLILTGGLATLAVPTASAEVLRVTRETPGKSLGIGVLLLLFMPVAGLVVLSTVLGFVVGLFLLLIYFAMLIVGLVAAMMAIGGWVVSVFGRNPRGLVLRLIEIIIGALAIFLLARLPVVAVPVLGLLLAFGVGLATLSFNRRVAGKPGPGPGTGITPATGADISPKA